MKNLEIFHVRRRWSFVFLQFDAGGDRSRALAEGGMLRERVTTSPADNLLRDTKTGGPGRKKRHDPSAGQYQVARIAEQSHNGPEAAHKKIADNHPDKEKPEFFKQDDPTVTHAQHIADPSDKKAEP